MGNDIFISVIIPAYNAERYIDKCIKSLINQSIFQNLEIIIINDGSTDSTPEIINNYSINYRNIKVFHTQNQGVSAARNLGIEHAQGKYITFVDSDDWLEVNCYEKMYTNAQLFTIDILAAGLFIDVENTKVITRRSVSHNTIMDGKKAAKEYLYGNLDVHMVNKLFRSAIIKNHRFDIHLKIAEDRLFLFECLLDAQKIFLMPDCFYHYYQNKNSAMNQHFSQKNFDNLSAGKKIFNIVQEKYPELLPYAKVMYINMECRLYGEIYRAGFTQKYRNEYIAIKQDIKCFNILRNLKYTTKKHVCAIFLAKISPSLYNYMRGNPILKFKR